MHTWSLCELIFAVLLINFNTINGRLEEFVVGGEYVNIDKYPHSVFLQISCYKGHETVFYICGSSIINQQFTLTAAHCMHDCHPQKSHISVVVGHEDLLKGAKSSVKSFKVHEEFAPSKGIADIGLVQLKTPLHLNTKIKRVALIVRKEIPQNAIAFVAGWGIVDDINYVYEFRLKCVNQTVWARPKCSQVLGTEVAKGTFCAGTRQGKYYAAEGDSGSALILNNYIQIGIVSFKIPAISKSLMVYTSVGYYYEWIMASTKKMFCG